MSSPIAIPRNNPSITSLSSSSDSSSATDGREWKKLSRTGMRILGACALVAFAVIAVAALAIGIAAMVNPVGLAAVGATVGAFVTATLAFAAEYSMVVLIVGAVSVGLLALAGVVSLVASNCGKDKDSSSSS